MYDKVYTYSDPAKEKKEETEEIKFGFKDIVAMTIAAYQIIFFPFIIFVLSLLILFFIFKLLLS